MSEQNKILRENADIQRQNYAGLGHQLQQERRLQQQTQYQLQMRGHTLQQREQQRQQTEAMLLDSMQQHEGIKNKVAVLQHELQE